MSRDATAARGYPAAVFGAARLVVLAAGADVGQRRLGVALLGRVAERDDPHRAAVLQDGHAADVVLAHDRDRLVDRLVGRDRARVARGDVADRRLGIATVG